MTEREKPKHGEIRQTACEIVGDAYRVEYTLYLDPRELEATTMKLTGPYRIVVEGDTTLIGGGTNLDGIGHLMQRLLTGEEAVMTNLANLGIHVRPGPDERARIVAYLREIAEGSADEDALKHAANSIEAGLDWDDEQ